MKEINYGFGNNGEIPFRYVKRKSFGLIDNVVIDPETGEEIIFENQAYKNSISNLVKGFKTVGVSRATRNKISKHCRVLGLASVPNRVRTTKGEYKTHLCTFITLTLPSEQVHTDQVITKKVLGKFLDKCRKLGLLSNYVWRAEKQKNGSIHYHILTDTFASFSLFRRIWYSALRELGYMQSYHKKFSSMSFDEYRSQKFNADKSPTSVASAYAHGVRCKWSEPPACHTTEIADISAVAKYVSKYISKSDEDNQNIVTGRSWGASKSVSKAVKEFCGDSQFSKDWFFAGTEIMKREIISSEFFSICLFRITSLLAWFPDTLSSFKEIFSRCFAPCNYWRNSVGLFS